MLARKAEGVDNVDHEEDGESRSSDDVSFSVDKLVLERAEQVPSIQVTMGEWKQYASVTR